MKLIVFYFSLFIGIFYFLYQLFLISNYLDIDVVNYYIQIKKGHLFHPHHLLYNFSGWIWLQILKDIPITDFLKLKIMNITLGSISIIFLTNAIYRYSNRLILSFLFVFFLIFTFDFIFYSQINDTAFFPTFISIVYISYIFFRRKFFILDCIILGILHGIAIGYHQTNIFIYFLGFFIILFQNKNIKKNLLLILVYTFVVSFVIITLYVFIGHIILGYSFRPEEKKIISGIPGGGNFYDWVFMYGHWDKELKWGTLERKHLFFTSLHTFSSSFFYHNIYFPTQFRRMFTYILRWIQNPDSFLPLEYFLFLLLIIVFIIVFLLTIFFFRKNPYSAGILFWFLFQSLLVIWWEPTNREFWLNPLFAFIMLNFITINELLNFTKQLKIIYFSLYIFVIIFYVIFIFSLWFQNSKSFFLPRKQTTYFGHWEDIYDQNYFTHIMDKDFRNRFIVITSPKRLLKQKLHTLDALRKKLSKQENQIYFRYYIRQFKQTIKGIENLLHSIHTDDTISISIEDLQSEIEQIENHYEDWLENYKNSSSSNQHTQKTQTQSGPD